jgi:hypothetical protein
VKKNAFVLVTPACLVRRRGRTSHQHASGPAKCTSDGIETKKIRKFLA